MLNPSDIGTNMQSQSHKKLVIVGNRFDLYHGFKTSFYDFLNQLDIESIRIYERIMSQKVHKSTEWCDIERNITNSVIHTFNPAHPGVSSSAFQDVDIKPTSYIQAKLKEYLLTQEYKKSECYSKTVNKSLNEADAIINFNYTNTLQQIYNVSTNKIHFIHGSIAENHIILGMNNDDQLKTMPDGYSDLSKKYLRDILNFRRYLKKYYHDNTKIIHAFSKINKNYYTWRKLIPELTIKEVINDFQTIDSIYQSSNQFFWNINYAFWLDLSYHLTPKLDKLCNLVFPQPIANYLSLNRFRPSKILLPNNVNPQSISEITIIGHSLKSDRDIISDLVLNSKALKKIYLFRYKNENSLELKKQIEYIHSLTNSRIKIISY